MIIQHVLTASTAVHGHVSLRRMWYDQAEHCLSHTAYAHATTHEPGAGLCVSVSVCRLIGIARLLIGGGPLEAVS